MRSLGDRQEAYAYGKAAEQIAEKYCLTRGDEILAKNFRVRRGEIDIVSRFGRILLFIEVKARQKLDAIHPLYSIDYRKRQRMRFAARVYWMKNQRLSNSVDEIRFDCISICGYRVCDYREGIFFSEKE